MTNRMAIERCVLMAFAAFMLSVPWLVPALVNTFWVSVIAEILIWSLFAASVNLLFGYVGLLSFGQALYFGFGMYGVGIGIDQLHLSFWPAFGLGIVGGDGDGVGVRHFRGPPDMALLRHHHRGVLAHLLLHRGDDEAAHRRRRRDQFQPAADVLHSAASNGASPTPPSSIFSFWRRCRSASI